MVCPFLYLTYGGMLCETTRPTPSNFTFNPRLSSIYTASFAPMPFTSGTISIGVLSPRNVTTFPLFTAFPQTLFPLSSVLQSCRKGISSSFSTARVAFISPSNTSGTKTEAESDASDTSRYTPFAMTLWAISLNTGPQCPPPEAGRPDFCIATIQLYFGRSEG